MAQGGPATFEPVFVDELAAIMEWAFAHMRKDGEGGPDDRTWLRDETGESVYLRLAADPNPTPGDRSLNAVVDMGCMSQIVTYSSDLALLNPHERLT